MDAPVAFQAFVDERRAEYNIRFAHLLKGTPDVYDPRHTVCARSRPFVKPGGPSGSRTQERRRPEAPPPESGTSKEAVTGRPDLSTRMAPAVKPYCQHKVFLDFGERLVAQLIEPWFLPWFLAM
jgi:hypothetical protein